jgi:DNA-binding MarR family transcriptional regulator
MNGMAADDEARGSGERRPGDDYYDVWLGMLGRVSRPRFVALILEYAGVTLDAELCQYLVHIDLRGPIGVLELAEIVEQNHPKASRSLARLERLGLVRRADAPYDRRIKTASVTPEGHRVVEAINNGRRRILDELFTGWNAHDRAELARLTRRFSDDMFELVEGRSTKSRENTGE